MYVIDEQSIINRFGYWTVQYGQTTRDKPYLRWLLTGLVTGKKSKYYNLEGLNNSKIL